MRVHVDQEPNPERDVCHRHAQIGKVDDLPEIGQIPAQVPTPEGVEKIENLEPDLLCDEVDEEKLKGGKNKIVRCQIGLHPD